MAVWSKVLPLPASCLSPLPRFECEKVAGDLGLGGGFRLGTPVSFISYNSG